MKNEFVIYFYRLDLSFSKDGYSDSYIFNFSKEYVSLVAYVNRTGEDLCRFIGVLGKTSIPRVMNYDKRRPGLINPTPRMIIKIIPGNILGYCNSKVPSAMRLTPREKETGQVLNFAIVYNGLSDKISTKILYEELINSVKEVSCYE